MKLLLSLGCHTISFVFVQLNNEMRTYTVCMDLHKSICLQFATSANYRIHIYVWMSYFNSVGEMSNCLLCRNETCICVRLTVSVHAFDLQLRQIIMIACMHRCYMYSYTEHSYAFCVFPQFVT